MESNLKINHSEESKASEQPPGQIRTRNDEINDALTIEAMLQVKDNRSGKQADVRAMLDLRNEDIKDKKLQAIMSNYSLITSQKVEGGVDDQHYAQVENMGDYLKGLDVLELDTGKYEDEPEDNDQSLKRKAQRANWSDWWDIKKQQNVKLQ